MKIRVAQLSLLVVALVGAAGCERSLRRGSDERPHLLMVVIDTLRFDRLGSYGSPRGLTPFLDEVAARGVRFEWAWASSSWTIPSVASLFTSRFPAQHRVNAFESHLLAEEQTLAETLAGHGYTTIGCSANPRLQPELGWDQGFQDWRAWTKGLDFEMGLTIKTRGPELSAYCLERLDQLAPPGPVFLYLQYMDPHTPYLPPEPYRSRFAGQVPTGLFPVGLNRKLQDTDHRDGATVTPRQTRFLEALYDGEVASVDASLRELFAELERRGFLESAVVVVTSDHGEEFRDHGRVLHGFTLYNETLRVPLLLQLPGDPGGRVVEEPVSLVDLAPTLLELLGLSPEPRFEGRSLAARLRGEANGSGDAPGVLAELFKVADEVRDHRVALLRDRRKLLIGPDGVELYDVASDPGEQQPLGKREAEPLIAPLQRWRAELATRAADREVRGILDPESRRELEGLGYIVR